MAGIHIDTERNVLTGIRFSTTSGQNICLRNHGTSAYWKLAIHTGTFCTNRSMQKGETLKVKLVGSGHVLVGLLPNKPNLGMAPNKSVSDLEPDGHWTHFRFRQQTTVLTWSRVKGRTVKFTTRCHGKDEDVYMDISRSDLYICFEIQFGDIQIEIEDINSVKKPLYFDNSRGGNILFANNQCRASLKDPNLSAICCTDRSLAEGEVININISPLDGATWTYTDMFLSNRSADELQLRHLETGFGELVPSSGIRVDKPGPIQLRLSVGPTQELVYTARTRESRVEVKGLDWQKPIYLCLRLFRNEVTIGSTLPEKDAPPYISILEVPGHPTVKSNTNSGYVDIGHFKEGKTDAANYGYVTAIPEEGNDDKKEGQILPHLKSADGGYITPTMQPNLKLTNDGYITPIIVEKNGPELTDGAINSKELQGHSNTADNGYITPITKPTDVQRNVQEIVFQNVFQNVDELLQPNPDTFPSQHSGPLPKGASRRFSTPSRHAMDGASGDGCFEIDHSYMNQQVNVPISISECAILGEFAERIRKNYVELCDRLEPDPVSDYFFQDQIISFAEHSSFLEKTRRNKVRFILEIAQKRPESIDTFFKALKNSAQDDLKNLLKK